MKIVFMGTPDFAVPCLQALIDNNHEIVGVVTQPDRAKGRGNKLAPPPVKVLAEQYQIPVFQPEKVKTQEFVEKLKELAPEIIVVVAFGQILSQAILDIPPKGCINVHGSLLPKYRGAGPIQWSIINGDKTTGVTTMYMDKGLDTGDMIQKREFEILEKETAQELHDKMSIIGAEVLIETLQLIETGKATRTPQDHEQNTYAPMLDKNTGKIDWSKSAVEVYNLIRGTYPWPGAYSSYMGKKFKIFGSEIYDANKVNTEFGIVQEVGNDYILISCGKGYIKIMELQFENEKRMGVEAYLRGHNIDINTRLV
ncbi:MAG: methionyl-tRNA formyltransferase [Clostridia bacterium]|jgi:methionyl-tRNA formyltransferase|nr:methionyl-tRNA formyltransferase [Clostridia bacterium]